jgi:hypothetical protein
MPIVKTTSIVSAITRKNNKKIIENKIESDSESEDEMSIKIENNMFCENQIYTPKSYEIINPLYKIHNIVQEESESDNINFQKRKIILKTNKETILKRKERREKINQRRLNKIYAKNENENCCCIS